MNHTRMKAWWLGVGVRVLACVLLAQVVAVPQTGAQPAMMDPSRMSGIPRQDPQVPTGTVTVRLIRGELTSRIPDAEVQLVPAAAGAVPLLARTDAEGRATFSGLVAGSYEARATQEGATLVSQPIEVAPSPAPGMRVMLVFAKSVADQQRELGTPDGKARVDLSLAPGILAVRVVDDATQPMAGLPVTLLSAVRGTEEVKAVGNKTTDAAGQVEFKDLPASTDTDFLVTVERDGSRQQSQPFQLSAGNGSRLAMIARATSKNVSALRLGSGSHLIFETQDDHVQVIENLELVNPTQQPIDTGKGIRLPLAENALSPQLAPNGPSQLTLDASTTPAAAVWKGSLPPGALTISVGFSLKHHGEVTFRQALPVQADSLRVIALKLPTLKLDGVQDQSARTFNGRELIVASAILPGPGGVVEFSLSGLPRDLYQLRVAGAILALLVGIGFTYVAARGHVSEPGEQKESREALMARREKLLTELLLAQDRESGEPAKDASAPRPSEKIVQKLEEVYRQLDELGA